MEPDSWESYFYPETYDPETRNGTLRNLYNERDFDLLRDQDYMNAAERERQLASGEVELARTYDAEHLRAIHRHLFQDTYEWAGDYRTVWLQKIIPFADVQDIPRYLEGARRHVVEAKWSTMDREQFADQAAKVFAHVNRAHPFREGNGRASKVFLQHVAEQSPFRLNYASKSPAAKSETWNLASLESNMELTKAEPSFRFLKLVLGEMAEERDAAQTVDIPSQSQTRSLLSTSYPQAASNVVRNSSGSASNDQARAKQTPDVNRQKYGVGYGE